MEKKKNQISAAVRRRNFDTGTYTFLLIFGVSPSYY